MKLALEWLGQGIDPAAILVRLAVRKQLLGCQRVLDVGCGSSSLLRSLGVPHPVGIEGYAPSVETARRLNTHDQIIHGDVRELDRHFQPKAFDACVSMDVIEHLHKPDGVKLMQDMESIAVKKVVLFTPSGFLPQRHAADDDLQEHLSGWAPSEMAGHGYRVTGFLGPKKLRGELHVIKYRPRVLWGMISLLGHFLWTRGHPEKAAAILCVKNLASG